MRSRHGFQRLAFAAERIRRSKFNGFAGREEVVLVEEISAEIDTAMAEAIWLDETFPIRILVSETNEALIGTQMLVDSILEIDHINSTVKITK